MAITCDQTVTSLAQRLREKLSRGASLSFEQFMARCLYDPVHGYYVQTERKIGQRGDFFTSVSVGPVLGELLAAFIAETWVEFGKPKEFTLMEQGAHDGQLIEDVLTALRSQHSALFQTLRVVLIEPLPARRAQQAERLGKTSVRVTWHPSLEDAPEQAAAVLIGNELLDAFPVQRWRRQAEAWCELAVTLDEAEHFVWTPLSPAPPPFALPTDVEEGYTTELCPALRSWVQELGRVISRGRVLLLDYGREAEDYFAPHRTSGTLRGYRQHQRCDDPFAAPGETDLTADVNYTHLRASALAEGWDVEGPVAQERLLIRLATPRLMASPPPDAKWVRQFQTLTHPAHLGRQFQAMVLKK